MLIFGWAYFRDFTVCFAPFSTIRALGLSQFVFKIQQGEKVNILFDHYYIQSIESGRLKIGSYLRALFNGDPKTEVLSLL